MVGSDPCRVERGGAPERSQRTRQGEKMLTNDDRMGLEGNKRGTRDQSGITEHQVGAGRRDRGGTPGAEEGEIGCGISTGDEADAGHTHPFWRRLGDGGGE